MNSFEKEPVMTTVGIIIVCLSEVSHYLIELFRAFFFGLKTFGIHFRKYRTPSIFMVSGPSGRDHDSQNRSY